MRRANKKLIVKMRSSRFMLGGALCLAMWLLMLRINGYAVIRMLERFALRDDGRYLLAAAACLVILNTVRAVPLYLGWFLMGEGTAQLQSVGAFSWLVPLAAIPASYALVSHYYGNLSLHFGVPALFSILCVFIMHCSTREIRGWQWRALVLAMLVFSFQWLDVAPMLTSWGFGGGELSMAVKTLSVIGEWYWVMDALAMAVFAIAFAGGIVAAALLVKTNMLNTQYRKLRERDMKIALLREEAVRARGYREIQSLVHDLRRPLTTVLGLADVLAETLPAGAGADYANRIVQTGAYMDHLVEELLKEEARQDVTVAALVEYIRSQISSLEWRHIVEVEVDRATSARVVCVNMVRFSRALVNLLDNAHLAVRGMQPRRIYFSAKAGKGEVLFKVEDNGRGFSDKFFGQGGFSEWGSTGIGLAFVAEVAKNHGGGMDIANLPAGGASVTVNIPLKEV